MSDRIRTNGNERVNELPLDVNESSLVHLVQVTSVLDRRERSNAALFRMETRVQMDFRNPTKFLPVERSRAKSGREGSRV